MTDIDVYQPAGGLGQYQAGIVMTPESAKAMDDQVRACTKAVLREGVDYGHIPGTSGEEKSLWRPGAQKLLQWFRLECICERIEVERGDDGHKHGITYRAEVGRGLKTASPVILATCEGTADYDESKFYQTAEEVQRKAETRERAWAEQYKRAPRPTYWQGLPEWRADWNSLMKRAQKRAIVGATVDATAAGGIFTDREEDDSPVPQDDGPTFYQQAQRDAGNFTDEAEGSMLYVAADAAYRQNLCNRKEKDHIQNLIRQRSRKIKKAPPVDADGLARQAAQAQPSDEGAKEEAPPARATSGQLSMLGQRLGKLGVEDQNRTSTLEKLAGRDLGEAKELTQDEATRIRGLLDRCDGDHGALVELLATGQLPEAEKTGDGDE